MSIITDIAHIDRQAWQTLMTGSPVASWFQSPEAYDFLVAVNDCLMPFVVAVEDDGLKGVVIGYTVANKGLQKPFTSRTVINGGPLLAADISEQALEALMNAVPHDAIYAETRNYADFSRWNDPIQRAGWHAEPHYDVHIDIDNLWRERIRTDEQQQIRKALREGQTWSLAQTEQDVRDWYFMLKRLYTRKVHRPIFPVRFFLTAWQTGVCKVLVVRDKDQYIIGGSLIPSWGTTAYEWYKSGPVMATYSILEYCEQNGIKRLDMMGGGSPEQPYSVREFKVRMGGDLCPFGRFMRIQKPLRYKLGKAVVNKLL